MLFPGDRSEMLKNKQWTLQAGEARTSRLTAERFEVIDRGASRRTDAKLPDAGEVNREFREKLPVGKYHLRVHVAGRQPAFWLDLHFEVAEKKR